MIFHSDFDVRLADGRSAYEGRVEVYYKGVWGTVCDDRWNLQAASVVCRQLGFPGPIAAPGQAFFSPGSGKIVLDEMECTGTEDMLRECQFDGFFRSDCSHSEDAGVMCGHSVEGKEMYIWMALSVIREHTAKRPPYTINLLSICNIVQVVDRV